MYLCCCTEPHGSKSGSVSFVCVAQSHETFESMTTKTTINKDVAPWGCEATCGLSMKDVKWLFSGERPVADVASDASLYR